MTKGDKPTTVKTTPHKKGSTSKYNKSSRSNSSKKTYWVVLPENKEGKWFAAELDATIYIKSLCGSPYELKNYVNFRCVETMVRRHNEQVGFENSKFLYDLKKSAGVI